MAWSVDPVASPRSHVRYDMGFHHIEFVMTMTGYVRLTTDGNAWMAELFQEDELPGM